MAPICIIETRLFDTLVESKTRSLAPSGKHHFAASAKLQAGETTLSIKSLKWQLSLPDGSPTQEYLITLYRPPAGQAALHVMAIEDLLAQSNFTAPRWLPAEIARKLERE